MGPNTTNTTSLTPLRFSKLCRLHFSQVAPPLLSIGLTPALARSISHLVACVSVLRNVSISRSQRHQLAASDEAVRFVCDLFCVLTDVLGLGVFPVKSRAPVVTDTPWQQLHYDCLDILEALSDLLDLTILTPPETIPPNLKFNHNTLPPLAKALELSLIEMEALGNYEDAAACLFTLTNLCSIPDNIPAVTQGVGAGTCRVAVRLLLSEDVLIVENAVNFIGVFADASSVVANFISSSIEAVHNLVRLVTTLPPMSTQAPKRAAVMLSYIASTAEGRGHLLTFIPNLVAEVVASKPLTKDVSKILEDLLSKV
eukprot:c3451_g1_i2.p1 GENE.c3451_g1_i2~~c3451_g1_i2.p1  ORF type:complete len:313 (+),score=89.10 c3451_g1_i2:3-941(+)